LSSLNEDLQRLSSHHRALRFIFAVALATVLFDFMQKDTHMARSRERNWFSLARLRRQKIASRKTPFWCRLGFEPLEPRRMLSLTIPAHNSRPGAFQSLYLNFVGSAPFAWSNSTGNYVARGPNSLPFFPTPIQAFSTDADYNNFSNAELTAIDHIWQWVAEKYSPFTINVTTVDPGFVEDGRTMTCIIAGSNNDWYPPIAGGTSSIGGFHDAGPNTCFVFSVDALNNGGPGPGFELYIGESIAHEAGHEVGLLHERTPGNEYYPGDSNRAPIMGGSSGNATARGLWWRTNNFAGQNSADPIQDELLALTQDTDRLHFATHTGGGNLTFNAAGAVNPVSGIINSTGDVDGFAFQATDTRATFTIKNWQYGGMLAPNANIRIAGSQNQVPITATLTNTSVSIETSSLIVGANYVLQVFSQGQYGDLGQYTVTGSQTQFAVYDAASRTVSVGGFAGNNNITLTVSYNGSQSQLVVQDSVNGGSTFTRTFLLSLVDSISIHLGAGDDRVNWDGLFKADFATDIPVYTSMGGGFDTLNLGGGSTFHTFNVGTIITEVTYGGSRISTFWNFDAERLELHGNSAGNDLFNINAQNSYSTIYAYAVAGANRLVIGPQVMLSHLPPVIFAGGVGNDTLELDGSSLTRDQHFSLLGGHVQRTIPGDPFAAETQFDSAVKNIIIKGGSGNDSFDLLSLGGFQTLSAIGNAGDDTYRVGNNGPLPVFQHPYTSYIFGTINVLGGSGNNTLSIDDVAYPGFFNGFSITSNSFFNLNTAGKITFDSSLQQLDFHASNAGSRFVTVFGLPATTALNLFGGTGVGDKLVINNQSLSVAPFRVELGADYYKEYYGTPQNPTIRQLNQTLGFENFEVTSHNNTNAIDVFATPASQFTQISAGSNTSAVTLYPHDANGNLTINGDLAAGGGNSKLIIDDTGQANPINYVFTNSLGITDRINGLGTGSVVTGSDPQKIFVYAGDGNDIFDFNQHKQSAGVAIYAGGGNDVLNLGSDNLATNISASIASFLFDGQAGYDTENIRNANHTDSWSYTISAASEVFSQSSLSGNYIINVADPNVEQKSVFAGPNGDTLQALGVGVGQTIDFHGAGGDDALSLASNPKAIAGRINFFGEAGTGNRVVQFLGTSDTVGSILHVNADTIGAFPGDTFFAPGGSMYFDSVAAITLRMGSGADTAYIAPHATATINISGGNPTAAPGDTLNLALAVAQNYVLHGTPASGSVTSDNLKTLTYSGFETGPELDDAAPYIVTQSYAAAPVPTILVQFSEDVSNALSVNYLELINTTTTEQVPFAYLNLAYDAGTNTASFTFPGYAGGILPPGDYTAKIYGSLPDQSGNVMGVETPFSFTVDVPPPALPGDYNLNGEVEAGDYILWRKTLGNTVAKYSGADGSGNGTIGPEDHDVWTANFGNALPAPASGNVAIFAEAHAGTESMRGSATAVSALKIATLEVPAVVSCSIDLKLPTVRSSEMANLNVALAFASAYGGTSKSSAFQAGGSVRAHMTADHCASPLTQPLTTVAGNRAVFDGYGRHFDKFEADNAVAGLMWEAVDDVFEADWAGVHASSV
jgi:hypothetical protein